MKKYKDMTPRERKVHDACHDAWWLSGVYEVWFDDHRRTFLADSLPILYNDVLRWHGKHLENHADARIVARCVKPC